MFFGAAAITSTVSTTTQLAVPMPAWLDLSALVVGSMAGVVAASTRHLDLVGHIGLSLICGLGGGLIRDVVMQVGTEGVYMLNSPYAIIMAIVVGITGFLFPRLMAAHPHLLEWLDIVSVGLFCVAGSDKAIVFGLAPVAVVLMGTLTGVGGGMMRDVFLGEVPRIFRSSNLYATCAVAGSTVYFVCADLLGSDKSVALIACVACVVILRRLSLHYDVQTTSEVSLEHHVRLAGRRVRQSVTAHTSRSAGTEHEVQNKDSAE